MIFCFTLQCSYRIPVPMSSSLPHLESFAIFRRNAREEGMGCADSTNALLIVTACRAEAQVRQKGKGAPTSWCRSAPPTRRHQFPSFPVKLLSSMEMATIS